MLLQVTSNHFSDLSSARRSILYVIRFGQEVDLCEVLDRVLQHISNFATWTGYTIPTTAPVRLHQGPSRRGRKLLTMGDLGNGLGVVADDDGGDEREEQADEDVAGDDLNANYVEAPSQDIDNASSESTLALERSCTTRSSTEVDYKLSRLPDFRLSHAWLRDGEEVIRYKNAVVEVKLCTEKTITSSRTSYARLINSTICDMAPQVIEAVQVAFVERPDQKEIVAIPRVNSFCCFVYFARSTVPALDPAMANEGNGFQDPAGVQGWKLYGKYARRRTKPIQVISGGCDFFSAGTAGDGGKRKSGKAKRIRKGKSPRVTFGDTFVTHWNDYVEWTRGKDPFPQSDEEE